MAGRSLLGALGGLLCPSFHVSKSMAAKASWVGTIVSKGVTFPLPLGPHRGKLFVPVCGTSEQVKFSSYSFFNLQQYSSFTYASNLKNESAALANRALKVTPIVDDATMTQFCVWVKANLKELFPGFRRHWPATCQQYLKNSNASPSVKAAIQRAKDKLTALGISENTELDRVSLYRYTTRKAFIKMENNMYSTPLGVMWKPPRLIQGAKPEFIALVGPTFMTIQSEIKRVWGLNFPICFTSGVASDLAAQHVDVPGWRVFENDVSSWDASMCKRIGLLECDLAKWMGAGRAVLALMKANVKTHGRTTHGCKYSVEGTRKSGDPYTSCYNSVINGLLHLYCFVKDMKRLDLPLSEVFKKLKMLVQGDDSLTTFHSSLNPDFSLLTKLGFKADNIHRKHIMEAEFCSCYVYRLKNGKVSFGPKLGRLMLKLLNFVEPPLHQHAFAVARGVAIGHAAAAEYVPGLKEVLDAVLRLTEGYVAVKPKTEEYRLSFVANEGDYIQNLYWSDLRYGTKSMKPYTHSLWSNVKFGDNLNRPCMIPLFERDTAGPKVITPL